jgi:Fe-S-cluster-containing dehydrogenase component
LTDGDVVTACQAACPTRAIHFGDLRDAGSDVVRAKASPRHYVLLEEMNTRPRTTYLARVEAGTGGGGAT